MKLRLLMSHYKISVRDTAIGKSWICSDLERGTLQECGPSWRGVQRPRNVVWLVRPRNVVWLVFTSWVISRANEWEVHSNNWVTIHALVFWQCLETVLAPLGMSFSLQIEDQSLLEFDLSSGTHFILIGLCCALGLCHFFKSCASPPHCFMLFFWAPSCPQCYLYNLLERQAENSGPLGGKYCIISNPSRHSGLHLPCFLQHVQQSISQWTC